MPENKRSRTMRCLYYVIPILLVTYVLSIGPVFALQKPGRALESFASFQTFYAPLYWGAHKSQFFRTQLIRYILFCEYLMNPPAPGTMGPPAP